MRSLNRYAFVSLVVLVAGSQQSHLLAKNGSSTYGFTQTQQCVQQLGANTPGFDGATLAIVDAGGAETYGGVSDGTMTFDSAGGFTLDQGTSTDVMHADNRLVQPLITPIPFGLGLGAALPLSCTGAYTVNAGRISVSATCTQTLRQPNVFNGASLQFPLTLSGLMPDDANAVVLTGNGNNVENVTIHFNGTSATAVQQRICTRSASLALVSQQK
jgi:hypothetical protein